MHGIAIIDRQPGADTIAIWVVSRGPGVTASNVNAVVIDLAADAEALAKVRSLTHSCAIIATLGTTLAGLSLSTEPLQEFDLDALLAEIAEHQQRIVTAVKEYKSVAAAPTLTEPAFPPAPRHEDGPAQDDSPAQRAFMLATYAGRVWSSWLRTDEERRKRTVQPKTGLTPWVMPSDMNQPSTPDFPPGFAALLRMPTLPRPALTEESAPDLNFTAIDFETANSYRGSPCSVGLVRVRNGEVTESQHWLIRPPEGADTFDRWNVGLHGITADKVADAPRWREILPAIVSFIGDDVLVAHNAGFDISVIRYACAVDNIEWPALRFLCTLVMSRRALALPSYRLPYVADSLGVSSENHHDALADAAAVAKIVTSLASRQGVSDLFALAASVGVSVGQMTSGTYAGAVAVGGRPDGGAGSSPVEVNRNADPNGYLFGRVVVFTGTLMSLTRDLAHRECAAVGGIPEANTTKRTNVLVVGDINPAALRPGSEVTGKTRKAFDLQAKGQDIEVMTEDEFIRCLDGGVTAITA